MSSSSWERSLEFWAQSLEVKCLSSLISSNPLAGVDMLSQVAANSSQLRGALTIMIGTSLVAMTIFLYPIFRKDSEELAMGMVIFRGALEGTWYFVMVLGFIELIALGNEYIATGANSAALLSMGHVLYQIQDRLAAIGPIFFLIGAMCLYISFYRTRLIPRWLSVWGLIGVISSLASALFGFFHVNTGAMIFIWKWYCRRRKW